MGREKDRERERGMRMRSGGFGRRYVLVFDFWVSFGGFGLGIRTRGREGGMVGGNRQTDRTGG